MKNKMKKNIPKKIKIKVGVMGKLENKTEKQLRQRVANLHEFILKHSFSKKLIPGDDYVYVCKFCGKEGYEKSSTQHKRLCEVGRLLKKHT